MFEPETGKIKPAIKTSAMIGGGLIGAMINGVSGGLLGVKVGTCLTELAEQIKRMTCDDKKKLKEEYADEKANLISKAGNISIAPMGKNDGISK